MTYAVIDTCDEILAEYDEVLHRARLKLDPAKCDYIQEGRDSDKAK